MFYKYYALFLGFAYAKNYKWRNGLNVIRVDGLTREFFLRKPANLQPGAPLVMVLHGYTSNALEIKYYSKFDELIDSNGFVAVYPQGTKDAYGDRNWNVGYDF
jgi:polyhydroxybutyrate depolymerase